MSENQKNIYALLLGWNMRAVNFVLCPIDAKFAVRGKTHSTTLSKKIKI